MSEFNFYGAKIEQLQLKTSSAHWAINGMGMKLSCTPQPCQASDQAVQGHSLSSPQPQDMGYLQLQQTDEETKVQRCAAITKLVKGNGIWSRVWFQSSWSCLDQSTLNHGYIQCTYKKTHHWFPWCTCSVHTIKPMRGVVKLHTAVWPPPQSIYVTFPGPPNAPLCPI